MDVTVARKTAAPGEIRQASDRFYAALNAMVEGDASSMSAAWVHGEDVTAMHPIGARTDGWDQVRSAFEQVGSIASGGQIRLTNQQIHAGTDLAYEVGMEEGEAMLAGERTPIKHRVTNIYRRDGDEWKMVHHHTDRAPEMEDLVSRLQSKH
jgi:ketosteroid isomerase-like protein